MLYRVRNLVVELGKKINVKISPHDLRRRIRPHMPAGMEYHLRSYYLGKISDTEAIRWMDILHGSRWTRETPLSISKNKRQYDQSANRLVYTFRNVSSEKEGLRLYIRKHKEKIDGRN